MKQMLLLTAALLMCCGAQSQYWRPVTSGTNKQLASISFGSPQVGYISGSDSLLLRSLDGGVSWNVLHLTGLNMTFATPDIIHVNFISAATGYAIVGRLDNPVYSGVLYRTNDSGKTWSHVVTGNIAASRTFFFDADNGYEIGSAFFAGKTIIRQSGGVWGMEKTLSFDPSQFLYGIDFRNAQTGIVGGHNGYVHRTFNSGTTWDTVKTIVDSTINDLKFLNDRTIMAGTDDDGGGILVSYDTGRTWQVDFNTLTFAYPDIKGLAVSGRDSFIAVGHTSFGNTGIILWQDGAFANNFMTTQRLNAVTMRDDSVAYIVGDSGTIFTNRQSVLGVLPGGGRAAQLTLYPNPAAGICYTQAAYTHTLRLYDATGRLVRERPRPALTHTIELGDLCPGVYMLQSSSGQGETAYQKLVVE